MQQADFDAAGKSLCATLHHPHHKKAQTPQGLRFSSSQILSCSANCTKSSQIV